MFEESLIILASFPVLGFPSPQSGHGQPQAGTQPSTPIPQMINPKGGVVRRNLRGWREWRRADPTLINSLWRSKMGNGIRKQLGQYCGVFIQC